jgi:hypothetical protein
MIETWFTKNEDLAIFIGLTCNIYLLLFRIIIVEKMYILL